MNKNKKNALWGVVVGSIVGSVTALLLAPKAGKELRKDIADGTATTLEKAQEIAAQASDKGVELYDKAKDVVVEVREWGKQRLGSETEETAVVSGITEVDTAEEVKVDAVDAVVDAADAVVSNAGLEDEDSSKIKE